VATANCRCPQLETHGKPASATAAALREAMLPAMTGCEQPRSAHRLPRARNDASRYHERLHGRAAHSPERRPERAGDAGPARCDGEPAGGHRALAVGADGLQACAQDQFAAKSLARRRVRRSRRSGRRRHDAAAVEPLEGQIFLGEPECAPCTPSDAQHGRLLRLLVQAQGSGVTVKFEGSARIDQSTGRLTASFEQLPQLPGKKCS